MMRLVSISPAAMILPWISQAKGSSLPFPYNLPFEQIQICLNGVPCQIGQPPSFSAFGGTGTESPTPSPKLTASASVTAANQQLGTSVYFTYYFEVSGAANTQVPLLISGSSSLMPPKAGAGFANAATLEFGLATFSTTIEKACAPVVSGCVATLSNNPVQESVTTNTIYEIDMLLGVGASTFPGGTSDSATGSMDPIISFLNASDESQFQLLFSDGVGNSPLGTETPLPAALPLFATGLGALGLLGWRRKRKAQAILAM